jgi:hypothetical protein
MADAFSRWAADRAIYVHEKSIGIYGMGWSGNLILLEKYVC